jgi:lambda family phage portal protein
LAYTIGKGIGYQARVQRTDNYDSELDYELNAQLEKSFNQWAENCDWSGRLHFNDFQRLAKRSDLTLGESIIIYRWDDRISGISPLRLQIIESDRLTDYGSQPFAPKAASIVDGIEFNNRTGRVIGYHFDNSYLSYSSSDTTGAMPGRMRASNVNHAFEALRPGQIRGVSPWTTAVLLANDLSDLMESELDGARMAAKWLAFVYRENDTALAAQAGIPGFSDESPDDDGRVIERIENGMIEYLRPGEKIDLASATRPGNNFESFMKRILQFFAIGTGNPYELISGDYAGLNYNTMRATRNDYRHTLKSPVDRHIRQICKPIHREWMRTSVVSGVLPIRDYFSNEQKYLASHWQPPGMEPVEQLRDVKAAELAIKTGLQSASEYSASRGRDYEEILREIENDKRTAAKYGVGGVYDADEGLIPVSMQTNPAALGDSSLDRPSGDERKGGNGDGYYESESSVLALIDAIETLNARLQ